VSLFAAALIYPLGVLVELYQEPPRIPPNILPWSAVELDAEPRWLAKFHIGRLNGDAQMCFEALSRSQLEYRKLDDRPLENGCGVANRTEIDRSNIPYSAGFESTCALAAALYWYEQRLDVLAQEYFDEPIVRIEHFGTYSCRNIYGRANARRSAHATAEAIDIAGFRLEGGEEISVLRDWDSDGAKADFLHAARDEACRFFGPVLSPDYNAAHANHFHLEVGRSWLCR